MLRKSVAVTALIFLLVPLAAQERGKGKGRGNGNGQEQGQGQKQSQERDRVRVHLFIGDDQRVMREYFSSHRSGGLPPGLAKRDGDLPPGLAKQLRRNGHLPPGLEKQLVPVPPDLELRLAPLEVGLSRGFIGGRCVIYNPTTRLILDVFIPLN